MYNWSITAKANLCCLIFFLLFASTSCNQTLKDEGDLPKFWCWMNYSPDKDWDEIFKKMSSVGMNGLLLKGEPRK